MKSLKAEIPEELNISYLNGIYDEPVMLRRVGEEYQAELPDLMSHNSPNYPERMALEVPVFMWDPSSKEEECKLLPGMRASTWTESEKEIFLVGIYIFGKRLSLVKRFLEGKKMGDVLGYYYGEFCKSDEHRKSKAKHCVAGTRIFSGWRLHEILSRLMESVPTGSHGQLQQIIKTYDQGESAFEDFIFTLKYATGAYSLAQAIGIGNWKRDLTRIRSNPTISTNQSRNRLEIPIGKRWSALSSEEIILKECLVPSPKRRRLTACKPETKSRQMKKSKDRENDENGSLWSHDQDTNQMICPKEVLKKKELEPVVDGNTENKGLNGTNGRRHGTRKRLPSTKALESLALGLLGTKRRKKNNEMKSISSVPTCLVS